MNTMAHAHSHADIAARLDTAERLCAERGSRLTPLRRLVLETLLRHQAPQGRQARTACRAEPFGRVQAGGQIGRGMGVGHRIHDGYVIT